LAGIWTSTVDVSAGAVASATQRNLDDGASGNLQYLYDGRVYKIAENVLGAPAATITFSSIPGTYRHLMIEWQGASNNVGGAITLMMRFNGDTGTNYDWAANIFSGAGVASSADSGTGDITMNVGAIGGTTSTGTSGGRIDIQNYAATTLQKTAISHSTTKNANTAGNVFWKATGAHWRSSVAVTSVALFPSAGSFITGTMIQLYGLN
jgi:hypothetical protein